MISRRNLFGLALASMSPSAVVSKSEVTAVGLDFGRTPSVFLTNARDLLCIAYARQGRNNPTDDAAAADLTRAAMTLLDLEIRMRAKDV